MAKLIKYEIFSTLFVLIIGTLLHFTFELFNQNLLIGIFSAVNESTWEHLKLVFFPSFFTTIIGFFILGKSQKYIRNKLKGVICALIFIVIFFYTYSGIIGKSFIIIDIITFIISIIISEYITFKEFFKFKEINKKEFLIYLLAWCILSIFFIIFTFYPPHIQLFKDPITNKYGIISTPLH